MKKAFFEIVKLDVNDVITTSLINSGENDNPGGGSGNTGGWANSVNINN